MKKPISLTLSTGERLVFEALAEHIYFEGPYSIANTIRETIIRVARKEGLPVEDLLAEGRRRDAAEYRARQEQTGQRREEAAQVAPPI